MGKRFDSISEDIKQFINQQKMFFVATAMPEGRVNLSPKGYDSLRILDANRVVWLNKTGSGNETATHVQHSPRMTLMFCAFSGDPKIVRLYGQAKVFHQRDPEWNESIKHFADTIGARQVFELSVDLVQQSCGFAIPQYEFVEQREILNDWAGRKSDEQLTEYWTERNMKSLDGVDTHVVAKD